MRPHFVPLLLATLVLAACGKGGVGVGSETTSGIETSEKSDISRSKTMSQSKTAKVSASVPAAQLIATVMTPVVQEAGIDLQQYVKSVKYDGGSALPIEPRLKSLGLLTDTGTVNDKQIQSARTALISLESQLTADPARAFAILRLKDGYAALAAGNYASARSIFSDFYTRAYVAAAILATSSAQKTPGLAGESNDGISHEREFPRASFDRWLTGAVTLLTISTELQSEWAHDLSGRLLRDEDAARLAIAEHLWSTPIPKIRLAAARPAKLAGVISTGPVLSPLEVFVPERNEYVTQNEKGLLLTRNGSIWSGDGLIAGSKTELSLEYSSSAALEKKSSMASDTTTKSGQSSKATTDIK